MRRMLRPLAALAVVALISTGCSNAPAAAAGAANGGSSGNNVAAATPAGTASSGHSTAAAAPAGAGNNTAATAPAAIDGSNTAANREQAVKFAECMRTKGVKGFPDPDPSGQLTIDSVANGSSLDTNSPAFKQALTACKNLEPAGFTGQKRTAQQQAAALKFAQCIRDNGVKDFPDPAPDAPLVDTNRIPSASKNGGMSILNAAMNKCGGMAADAGVSGGQ